MSEKLQTQHEQFEKFDDKDFEKLEKQAEKTHEKAAERSKDKSNEIDKLLKKVEKEAVSRAELSKHHQVEQRADQDIYAYSHHHLTTQTFNQTIKRVQKKLPAPQRAFSKIIHNPQVEMASDAIGNTLARPLSLLWGGLFSALASLGVLILCRYYGYEYNFSIGLISFVGGYLLGLLVEVIVRLIRRS